MLDRTMRLVALCSALCLGACAPDDDDDDIELRAADATDVAQTIEALGLSDPDVCGHEMVRYKPGSKATRTLVFTGRDEPWHKWRKCLEALTDRIGPAAPALVRDTVYNQVLYLLSHRRVELRKHGGDGGKSIDELLDNKGRLELGQHDRLVETNDHGVAYSAMDQVDMGILLLRIHKALVNDDIAEDHRTEAFLGLGMAALDVLVDDVRDGGLRSKQACEKDADATCAWFHAVTGTDREQTEEGGTLNKHLYGVRDLYQAGKILLELDRPDLADRGRHYQNVAMQGMNQLVLSPRAKHDGDLPNLLDYVPRHRGKPIRNSWLYYGRNIVDGRPYFLESEYKNCNYHLLVIKLLHRNIRYMLDQGLDVSEFGRHRDDLGTSLVDFVIDTYERKRDDEGLYADAPSKPGGNFTGCDAQVTPDELDPVMLAELRAMVSP